MSISTDAESGANGREAKPHSLGSPKVAHPPQTSPVGDDKHACWLEGFDPPAQRVALLLPLQSDASGDTRKIVGPLIRELGIPTELAPDASPNEPAQYSRLLTPQDPPPDEPPQS